MARYQTFDDPDWEDDDWNEGEGFGADDESTTTECIYCGADIYDDSPRCPICGEYQVGSRSLTAWEGRPLWWKLGGLLGIFAAILGMLWFCF